ncbi:hypothetical protein LguiB_004756 [Lonicera macranthoides]
MDSYDKPTSASPKSKLSRTFHKVIHLKSATKSLSNNGFCLLIPQKNLKNTDPNLHSPHPLPKHQTQETESRNRASMEAFIAKLFATITLIKAAYAELQIAQFPYNADAIESADQAVVNELKALSEMKQSFFKKQIDSSPPHVTLLLCEIQEQQGLMKMYEITAKKMEGEIDAKELEVETLKKKRSELCSYNKSLEKKLNSSGSFSVLDFVKLSDSNPKDFVTVLNYAIKSVRNFVKLLIRQMESAHWDIDVAASAIEPDLKFINRTHVCFVFESFVCNEMFNGFNNPNFSLPNATLPDGNRRRFLYVDRFKNLKSENAIKYMRRNKDSTFGKFVRAKYLCLVHPKMEASFSGNLNQRKMVSGWEFPETAFFIAFAEMARRVWLLHCLAFSFEQEVGIFQLDRYHSRQSN